MFICLTKTVSPEICKSLCVVCLKKKKTFVLTFCVFWSSFLVVVILKTIPIASFSLTCRARHWASPPAYTTVTFIYPALSKDANLRKMFHPFLCNVREQRLKGFFSLRGGGSAARQDLASVKAKHWLVYPLIYSTLFSKLFFSFWVILCGLS